MVNITAAAQAAIVAYGAAVQLGGNASVPLSEAATAMSALYLPGFTSFTLGSISVFENATVAAQGIAAILTTYNQSGLGTDIRLADSRVEPVSDLSAFCWITWKIFPRNCSLTPWEFVDVYGFRIAAGRPNGLEGGWEMSNADNEIQEVLARVPNFFGKRRRRGLWYDIS